MEQKALISVIVPVYNVESYLPRCVDSICNQTYRNLEIILVDDGATDSSGRICDDYASRDPRVRVIHKANGGLSSARNAGLDVAQGEYISFIDSDDWIAPDTYDQMLALALEEQVKLVCAGRFDVDGGTGRVQTGLCPPRREVISGMELLGRVFLWDNCDSAACDKLYHRSLFREIRYPVGRVNEDLAIFYKLMELTDRAAMLDKPVYYYYHRADSISNSALSPKTFHFVEYTAQIYPYICQNHPGIQDQARYFRIRSLIYSMQRIDLASDEDRNIYREQYRSFRKALRTHLPFILSSDYFTNRNRIDCLFLASGLYYWGRKLYHMVK